MSCIRPALFAVLTLMALILPAQAQLGRIFDGHQDVGIVLHPGSVLYAPATRSYTVAGSGENMWFGIDDFHFVWKKVSGDVVISASIAFVGAVGDPHRKAVLMMRQTLEGPSVAVDIAVHGSGLTSLQFRDATGGNTHEVQSNVSSPESVRLEKRGDFFYAFVAGKDHVFTPAGASIKIPFPGDFYAGIGVCSHNKDDVQKAIFDNVSIQSLASSSTKPVLYSSLETVAIASTDRHVEYVAPAHFEAPNWSRDGSFLIFNQDGALRRLTLPSDSGSAPAAAPTLIPTAPQVHINNDHGLSPDGTHLAISDTPNGDRKSRVYVVPVAVGAPRLITSGAPLPTGTAGPLTAKHSSLQASAEITIKSCPLKAAAARSNAPILPTSTFTRLPQPAAMKPSSPLHLVSTMAPNSLPTALTSISTPSGQATCRSGACTLTDLTRRRC